MNELSLCATSLEQKLSTIGKYLLLSGLPLVKEHWKLFVICNNYSALYEHFLKSSNDYHRESKERAKYIGLKTILVSVEFVHNLGL